MHTLPYHFDSDVAPRLQWNSNWGYCGETSFICAGMSLGQYCSQWTARALASPGVEQHKAESQLLVGTDNAAAAASAMRLRASDFPSHTQQSTQELIVWAKSRLLAGQIPIIGVFNNGIILGEWKGHYGGDADYDHIVPVLGWASDAPLEKNAGSYRADDVIIFSDNGLYGPVGIPARYPFQFFYEVGRFQGTREQANQPEGAIYTLKNTPQNSGIAIEGIVDHDGACIPVRLSSDKNYEWEPELEQTPTYLYQPPTPIDLQLTVTVELPDQSVAYNLYQYDQFENVPVAGFNAAAAAGNAAQVYRIPAGSGPAYQNTFSITSDQTVVFRAVPASAP